MKIHEQLWPSQYRKYEYNHFLRISIAKLVSLPMSLGDNLWMPEELALTTTTSQNIALAAPCRTF